MSLNFHFTNLSGGSDITISYGMIKKPFDNVQCFANEFRNYIEPCTAREPFTITRNLAPREIESITTAHSIMQKSYLTYVLPESDNLLVGNIQLQEDNKFKASNGNILHIRFEKHVQEAVEELRLYYKVLAPDETELASSWFTCDGRDLQFLFAYETTDEFYNAEDLTSPNPYMLGGKGLVSGEPKECIYLRNSTTDRIQDPFRLALILKKPAEPEPEPEPEEEDEITDAEENPPDIFYNYVEPSPNQIFSPEFNGVYGRLQIISSKFQILYNGIGKFSMVVILDEFSNSFIKINSFIMHKGVPFIVVRKQIDTVKKTLTINGFTANYMLQTRLSLYDKTFIFGYELEKSTYDVIEKNRRGLPIVYAPIKNLTIPTSVTVEIGNRLSDEIINTLKEYGLGHRLIFNPKSKNFTFEIYKGRDLTQGDKAVIFAPERGTAKNLVINDDNSTMYNYFGINFKIRTPSGKMSNDFSTTISLTEAAGLDEREYWFTDVIIVNSDSEVIDEGTAIAAGHVAQEEMKRRAARYLARQNFSVDINPVDFGTLYNLGDEVLCVSNEYGVKFSKKVEAVEYTTDSNGEKTKLTLGEPSATIIDFLRKQGE